MLGIKKMWVSDTFEKRNKARWKWYDRRNRAGYAAGLGLD